MGRRGMLRTLSTALIFLAAAALPADANTDAEPGLALKGQVLAGAAEWVTSNRNWLVFGAGSRVTVAAASPDLRVERVLTLEAPVTDGWIAGHDLYVVRQTETADELVVANLEQEELIFRATGFGAAALGSLRITQMGDYLVVAESGSGLHLLQLPRPRHPGMLHHAGHTAGLSPLGFLSLTEPIAAVTATFNTVYVATNELLIEINVAVPSVPVVTRRLSSPAGVRALSADGDTVRVLADDGLHTLDVSRFGEARTVAFDPDVQGHSLMSLGRSVYVGGGADRAPG